MFQLIYRIGDKAAFTWKRAQALPFASFEAAVSAAAPLTREGLPCAVLAWRAPMPTTFHPHAGG